MWPKFELPNKGISLARVRIQHVGLGRSTCIGPTVGARIWIMTASRLVVDNLVAVLGPRGADKTVPTFVSTFWDQNLVLSSHNKVGTGLTASGMEPSMANITTLGKGHRLGSIL